METEQYMVHGVQDAYVNSTCLSILIYFMRITSKTATNQNGHN